MKKKGALLIAAAVTLFLISCQNELVKKIKDQLQVNTPVISETDEGLDKVISINSTTPGADLYYTTDNTEPKPSNPSAILYTGPISLSGHGETIYIRARGFKTEMTPSGEAVAQFGNVYPSPPPPVLSQGGGIFSVPQSIDISYPDLTGSFWETDGVTIHYTLDGSSPTAASPVFQPGVTSPIPVDPGTENYTATVILNAVCIHPAYPASRAASAVYTVSYTAKASPPTITAEDTSNPGVSLTSGVVFAATEVTVTRPASTMIHFRTREDAGDWSAWSTASSDTVVTILDNSPRDGAVVTVQAYASRPGYRDSDMAVTSFSYLVLTVAPPILTNAFTTGETYGRNLEIVLAAADPDADIYYSLDGSVPTPAGSPLFSGSISGTDDTVYAELTTGEPLYINAVCVVGGRISPVSTYWCRADATPPGDVIISTPQRYHEGIRLAWDPLAVDDTYIVEYKSSSATVYTAFAGTVDPAGTDLTGLTNGQSYDLRIRSMDKYGNYQTDGVAVTGLRPYSVTHTGDTTNTSAAAYVGSFRQAVTVADSGDSIVFDPDLFGSGETIALVAGVSIQNTITIEGDSDNDGDGDVILDGQDLCRILNANGSTAGSVLTLNDLTLRNGNADSGNGGALLLTTDWSAEIDNCTFDQCTALNGGAVYGFDITFNDSTLTNNAAIVTSLTYTTNTGGGGGAVCSNGELQIIGSTLTGNHSVFLGGAVVSGFFHLNGDNGRNTDASLFISNSVFSSNYAGNSPSASGNTAKTYGGAVYFTRLDNLFNYNSQSKHVVIVDTEFSSNYAGFRGGAINGNQSVDIYISDTVFETNSVDVFSDGNSDFGGSGILLNQCDSEIRNSFFIANETLGTAPSVTSGSVVLGGNNAPSSGKHDLYNCLFYKNNADSGPATGLYVFDKADVTANNCTFYYNQRNDIYNNNSDTNPSKLTMNKCIASGISTASTSDSYLFINNSLIQTLPNSGTFNLAFSLDPLYTHSSTPDGGDGIWGNENDGLIPQASSPANISNDPSADIGCYDIPGTNPLIAADYIYVTATQTGNGSSWTSALSDPQEAIDLAAWYRKPEVRIADGTYVPRSWPNGGSTNEERHFAMRAGVSVKGGYHVIGSTATREMDPGGNSNWDFEYSTVFSGDYGSGQVAHIFYHPDGNGLTDTTVLEGVTIKNGGVDTAYGGGIYQVTGHIKVQNSIFHNNTGIAGGAVYADTFTSLVLTKCYFKLNDSLQDGGAIFGNTNGFNVPFVLDTCTFGENNSNNQGGAVFIKAPSEQSSIKSCQFSNNYTRYRGGALYLASGGSGSDFFRIYDDTQFAINYTTDTVLSSTLSFGGGAVYSDEVDLNVENTNFTLNYMTPTAGIDNSANGGGAVFLKDVAAVNFFQSTFVQNGWYVDDKVTPSDITVTQQGGAAMLYNTQAKSNIVRNFMNCTFFDNRCIGGNTGSYGGAVYDNSTVSGLVSNYYGCRFESNFIDAAGQSGFGGALSIKSNGRSNIVNSFFIDNQSLDDTVGGALYIENSADGTFDYILGSVFVGNKKASCFATSHNGVNTVSFIHCTLFRNIGDFLDNSDSSGNDIYSLVNSVGVGDGLGGSITQTFSPFYTDYTAGSFTLENFLGKDDLFSKVDPVGHTYIGCTGGNSVWGDDDDGLIPISFDGGTIHNSGALMSGTGSFSFIFSECITSIISSVNYNSDWNYSELKDNPKDIRGEPRILFTTPDVGAYESPFPPVALP